jgi:hypothetical protein
MDNTYKPYLKDGELYYTGAPYNLEVHPGRGRVEIQFTPSKDPNIAKYIIFWNNMTKQQEVKPDTGAIQKVIVPNLAEGDYTFELVAYDQAGNASTPGSALVSGSALGSVYEANLAIRLVTVANSSSGIILNFASVDTTCKNTIVSYPDSSGGQAAVSVSNMNAVLDTLKDFSASSSSLQFTTAYVPVKGIDTFYATKPVTVNLVAADYVCTGTMVDLTSASLTGPYPWNVTWRAVTPTELELVDDDYSGDVYHKILSGGSPSYYGEFGVVINLDNNYNVISVVNKYGQPSPSRGRSAELDPTGVNKFDPVGKVLKVKYWMDQPGTTHRTSFDETFTMK